jgi:dTDP-4-dehydrorhamnose reductase
MNDDCLLPNDKNVISVLDGKRFLITGAGGMLGQAFANKISKYLPNSRMLALSRSEFDICNYVHLKKIETERPDFIIHCGGLVNADICESQPEDAKNIILNGTKNICRVAQNCGSLVLYPQTFLIFSGIDKFVDEDTIANPLSTYGLLKLEAESESLQLLPNSLSLRLGGFFGGGKKDKNFVGKFLSMIKLSLKNKEPHLEVGNRIWQPTFTEDIAANSLLLLAEKKSGIYCMASHGSASFFELATEILSILGLRDRVLLSEIDSSLIARKELAARPKSLIIINKRLQAEKMDRQREWTTALSSYLLSQDIKM